MVYQSDLCMASSDLAKLPFFHNIYVVFEIEFLFLLMVCYLGFLTNSYVAFFASLPDFFNQPIIISFNFSFFNHSYL